MNVNTIVEKLHLNILFEKIKHANKNESKLQIKDFDEDSEVVNMDKIGITEFGQGAVILKTDDGKEFPISAFSPETAKNISDFRNGKRNEVSSMYNMLEQICEDTGLLLVKVRIYDNGQALRANLYFTGKKELILRNYRASDAIALATFYSIPILIKKNLLEQSPKINSNNEI
jgi:bifunctional DNase/RNase